MLTEDGETRVDLFDSVAFTSVAASDGSGRIGTQTVLGPDGWRRVTDSWCTVELSVADGQIVVLLLESALETFATRLGALKSGVGFQLIQLRREMVVVLL